MTRKHIYRITAAVLVALLPSITVAAEAPADSLHRQSVGLVLSGGGAKGIAHIGVIQALEENDIPIDYITGTSMGAIVGGLYAAGYTPQEMLQLILSKGFSYWSTGAIDPELKYYFTAEQQSPEMFSKSIPTRAESLAADSTAVPASLISPLPMSYAFMQLFAPYTAQCGGDFDRLFVPFRCCASDVAAHHRVVISKGDFADAIRSSMSYPIVFQPTEFEGTRLYDGGLYDNFPADVMRDDFNPDFVIGVDVSTKDIGPQTSLMDQLGQMIVQGGSYYLDPVNGIKIDFDLNRFGLLDFPQAQEIYEIGYQKGMEMVDSIKSRVTSRVPSADVKQRRADFNLRTPRLAFDDVQICGAPAEQVKFLRSLFPEASTARPISLHDATAGYYRAISTGELRDFQPHAVYDDNTGLFDLRLKASVKDDLKVGAGGYLSSSSSSYLYFTAGYNKLSFNALSAKLSAWVGQSYLAAMAEGRWFLPTGVPSALEIEGVASRTNYYYNDKMFFSDVPSFAHGYQYYGRLKWDIAAGSLGKLEVGAGGSHLRAGFYRPITEIEAEPYHDHMSYNLAQAYVRYTSSTLSDINYPISGHYYNFAVMGVAGNYHQWGEKGVTYPSTHPRWIQAEVVTRNYFEAGRHFSFGIESDIMASTRKLLPTYNASIFAAPAFSPTPSSCNIFNPAFRANSFVAASIVPVYRFNTSLSARLDVSGFVPVRKILPTSDGGAVYQGRWIGRPEMFTELSLCYSTPVGTISAYGNYATSPENMWTVGLSFGVYLHAPDFLR